MKLYITLIALCMSLHSIAQINLVPITPPDLSSGDGYGISTCVSGDFMIVGSYNHDLDRNGNNFISDCGSAYIFTKMVQLGNKP